MSLIRSAFVPVAAVLVFASGLMAQVDAAAKQLLEESSKVMSEIQHVTMNVKTSQPGTGGSAGATNNIDVTMLKGGKEFPLQARYKGSLFIVSEGGNKDIDVLIQNLDAPGTTPIRRTITWRDDAQKKVLTQPTGPNSTSDIWVSRCERLVLGPFEPTGKPPFDSEIRGRSIEVVETKEFDGVPCQVLKIDVDGKLTRTVAIGLVDKLPRFYERRLGGLAQNWTFTKVNIDNAPTAKDLEVSVPKDYKAQRLADPTPAPKPATPPGGPAGDPAKAPPANSTPKGTGLKNPPGGLVPGAAAPAWELTGVDNTPVKSADLKGKTVVLAFFGPQFPLTANLNDALQTAAGVANTKAFAVACRLQGDEDVSAIKKTWTESNPGFPALVNGDDVAAQLNVRGFPSVVVIGPDGTIKKFFEGDVNAETLASVMSGK